MKQSIWNISITDSKTSKISFLIWVLSIILFGSLLTFYQSVPLLQNKFFPNLLILVIAIGVVSFVVAIISTLRYIKEINSQKNKLQKLDQPRYLILPQKSASIFNPLVIILILIIVYLLGRQENLTGILSITSKKTTPTIIPTIVPTAVIRKVIQPTKQAILPTSIPTALPLHNQKVDRKIPVFIGSGYNFTVNCPESNVQVVRDINTQMEKEYNKAFEDGKKCISETYKRNGQRKADCDSSCQRQKDNDYYACSYAYKSGDSMYTACNSQSLDEYGNCLSKCPSYDDGTEVCKQDNSKGDALFDKIRQLCGF